MKINKFCFQIHKFHKIVERLGVARDLKDHLAQIPVPWEELDPWQNFHQFYQYIITSKPLSFQKVTFCNTMY